MTAVFIDTNGVKRNFLWQYDKGQTLLIGDIDYDVSPEVHFTTSAYNEAIVAQATLSNGTLRVHVPDVLLLEARKITVYLYINGDTRKETLKTLDIFVRPRKKPNDYIYNDEMYVIGIGPLRNAINNYMDANFQIIEDAVIDYTTVTLTDDTTGAKYKVGVNNNKLYIKEV